MQFSKFHCHANCKLDVNKLVYIIWQNQHESSWSKRFYDVSEILDVCDASKNDWSCCTPSTPCGVGKGDCDKDSDCSGNLECGTNNCKSFNSAWSSIGFDCCTEG